MTSFPYSRVQGRPGSGQVQSTPYSVQNGALPFWLQHLDRRRVAHSEIQERFGQRFIAFKHPSGLGFEVIEDPRDSRRGTAIEGIGEDESVRGFDSITLSVRECGPAVGQPDVWNTVHHVAYNVPNDEDLKWQKAYYEELGYTDVSEVKDRNYFHSIYVRSPG